MPDKSRRIRQIDLAIAAVLLAGLVALFVVTPGLVSDWVNDLVGAVIVKRP